MLFNNLVTWLTFDDMARLFDKSRSTINEHILNIYAEGELEEKISKRKIGISDFSTKPTNYYNLDIKRIFELSKNVSMLSVNATYLTL